MAVGAPGTGDGPAAGAAPLPGRLRFACPTCRAPLESVGEELRCPAHGAFPRQGGVWRFLTPDRQARYARFMEEYRAVRRGEERGSEDPQYYRRLPFEDRTGRREDQWRVRARTFRTFLTRVLEPLEEEKGEALSVVDLGAGNGWLSNRLAERGHHVVAVDLGDDPLDGLGTHDRYGPPAPFVPVQADYDRLPLTDGCADLAVFNASLHYSTDCGRTLQEALRVVAPDGAVAVLDTPVYRDPRSGRRMVREREAYFRERFGFPSDALPSENFLTPDRLDELARELRVRWRVHRPGEGLRRTLRRWSAPLLRRREPASFWIVVATPGGDDADEPSLPRPLRRRRGLLAETWRMLLRARYVLFQRHRRSGPVLERVAEADLLVLPGVFNPRLFRSGAFLAEEVAGRVPDGASVLDLGTGSGAAAVVAARRASRVVAVDVNPRAVLCARANALLTGVDGRVEVRGGDLFEALAPGERFDTVLFNPPFFQGRPRDPEDAAWRSVDVPERFAAGLADHLEPGGHALVVLSSDGGSDAWLRAFAEAGLAGREVARRDLVSEVLALYRVEPRHRSSGGGST